MFEYEIIKDIARHWEDGQGIEADSLGRQSRKVGLAYLDSRGRRTEAGERANPLEGGGQGTFRCLAALPCGLTMERARPPPRWGSNVTILEKPTMAGGQQSLLPFHLRPGDKSRGEVLGA